MPAPSVRWIVPSLLVSPTNELVLMGGQETLPAAQLCEVPQQYHAWLYAIDINAAVR